MTLSLSSCSSSDTINVYYPHPAQPFSDTTICAGDTLIWNTSLDGPYSYLWSDGSTANSLEITAAGDYFVVITDTAGFSWFSDTVRVDVDDYPLTTFFSDNASSHSIDTALCVGNSLGLAFNADVTASYLWSNGASSERFAPTLTGDYSLVSANARGCQATNSAHVFIKGEAPAIDFSVSSLCLGDSTLFDGNASSPQGIASYLWIVDEADSVATEDFMLRFATAGIHSVRVEVASNNSCLNDSSFTINIKDTLEAVLGIGIVPPCMTYKQKVIDYLAKNKNLPVIQKIFNLEKLTI